MTLLRRFASVLTSRLAPDFDFSDLRLSDAPARVAAALPRCAESLRPPSRIERAPRPRIDLTPSQLLRAA